MKCVNFSNLHFIFVRSKRYDDRENPDYKGSKILSPERKTVKGSHRGMAVLKSVHQTLFFFSRKMFRTFCNLLIKLSLSQNDDLVLR